MTEELQGALTEILNGVLTAKDFMLAELPEVVQQLLLWKFWIHFIYFIVCLICVIISGIIAVKVSKFFKESGDEIGTFIAPFLVTCAAGFPLMGAIFNLTWLQIWLAPKVYLIEYAASLAK